MRPPAIIAAVAAVLVALVTVILTILSGGGTQGVAQNYNDCVTQGGQINTEATPLRCTLGDRTFTTSAPQY